jgi:uncharacterized protein (TIGR02391 family)
MKRLPAAFADLTSQRVVVRHHPGTSAEKHTAAVAHIDPFRGIFPVTTPISPGDVVEYEDAAGRVTRLVAGEVKVFDLITPSHTDVFWEGALVPRPAAGASLGLGDLHREVVAAASGLFDSASYSEAVLEALLALEHRVSRQSGIEAEGRALMEQAFSGNPPPITVAVREGPEGRVEQDGLRLLFSGVVEAIESPKRHELIHGDSPERALEQLAMVSALFHLLDYAYHRKNAPA